MIRLAAAVALVPALANMVCAAPVESTGKPDPAAVARRIDDLMKRTGEVKVAPPVADDATLFRRLNLDLTGKLPNLKEAQDFLADRDPGKRDKVVERLLKSEGHAVNWGRYWRDVLTYHTPASANYIRWPLFNNWMVDQVRRNRPWSDVVTDLVTATGTNDETGPVNFLTAHFGNPVEIAATTSRVFLGVQLQCAQCHDAKMEPWRREQFHELVAFFGRAKIIQHKDVAGRGTPYAIEGRDEGQYGMTDLKNPSRLIPMTPRFLTGETVSADAGDVERRAALARFLTSPKNPYFAPAHVNRMWMALMGWGFYPGLADLGAHTEPRYPEVLEVLAREWTASGYDMHWLFRTIVSTEAYRRQLQPRPVSESARPAALCPQRLRPEQIFEALVAVLGFDENDKKIPAPAPSSAPALQRHQGLRNMIYQAFKVDPSLPPNEVQGTIPQALVMMNSVLVNSLVAAKGKTFLGEALAKNMKDDDLVVALYQRTLARPPRAREMETCRRYLRTVTDRREAFEDIFWSLINSTEFLTKR
jgi:hypothetical protein